MDVEIEIVMPEVKEGHKSKPKDQQRFGGKKVVDEKPMDDISELAESLMISDSMEDGEELTIETVTIGETPYNSAKTFEELNLSQELLKGIYIEMRFERPSKIQALTLPMILTPPYQHMIAQGHNGSGKTICFVLSMLSRVDPTKSAPQALCVCPTRELALQTQEVIRRIGRYTRIKSACAVREEYRNSNGTYVPMSKREVVTHHIIVGTPGTLRRWIATKILSCRYINVLVFDEADQMLAQDGFQDDSLRIIKEIQRNHKNYQILLFSATFNDTMKTFATRIIPKANKLFVRKEELSLDIIKQYCLRCPDQLAKIEVLKDKILPLAEMLGQAIIFVRTKENARRLHDKLEEDGYKCTSIHGDLNLQDRDCVINEFKRGITRILISTDMLARGFDQAQVTLVVNFDLPVKYSPPNDPDYEVYLHRIGRSGRFGRKGAAFNLLCIEQDEITIKKIQEYFQKEMKEIPWDNVEALENALKEAGLA